MQGGEKHRRTMMEVDGLTRERQWNVYMNETYICMAEDETVNTCNAIVVGGSVSRWSSE